MRAIIFIAIIVQAFAVTAQSTKQLDKWLEEAHLQAREDTVIFIDGIEKAQKDAISLQQDTSSAKYLMDIADVIRNKSQHIEKAKELYEIALEILEQNGDVDWIIESNLKYGTFLAQTGDLDGGLKYYDIALQFSESNNHVQGKARSHFGLGLIYRMAVDSAHSMRHYSKALTLYLELNDSMGYSDVLNNVANALLFFGDSVLSIEKHKEILQIRESLNYDWGVAQTHGNIGRILLDMGRVNEAIEHINIAASYFKEKGNPYERAQTFAMLGNCYLLQNNLSKGWEYHNKAHQLYDQIGALELKSNYFGAIADFYERIGYTDSALHYYKQHMRTERELLDEETSKNFKVMSAVHEKRESEKLRKELQAKADLQQELIERKEREQTYLVIGLASIALLLVIAVNRFLVSRKQKRVIENQKNKVSEQKDELEEKNREITDSITYAKRIQEAILPSDHAMKEAFGKYAVLYLPKDIVAGDFYWLDQVNDRYIFAVADCTGHGVPGAMVSIVCHNALNRAVHESQLSDPGLILDKVREDVAEQFNNEGTIVSDGMDIALITYHSSTRELKYAGANNPLWIQRAGQSEVEETKATKQPIGRVANPESFVTHTKELREGDRIFLFSDGYPDQFGGEKGKKLRTSNFKKILADHRDKPVDILHVELNEKLKSWMGDLEQIDDICVVGFEV